MSESSAPTPEALAAEEAIEADRNAPVATSGIDSESPSALFVDAAPNESPSSISNDNLFEDPSDTQDSFASNTTDESMFPDEESYADDGLNQNVTDGEILTTLLQLRHQALMMASHREDSFKHCGISSQDRMSNFRSLTKTGLIDNSKLKLSISDS